MSNTEKDSICSPMRASKIIRRTEKSLERGRNNLIKLEKVIKNVDHQILEIQKVRRDVNTFLDGNFCTDVTQTSTPENYQQPPKNLSNLQNEAKKQVTPKQNIYKKNRAISFQLNGKPPIQRPPPAENNFFKVNFLQPTRCFIQKLEMPVQQQLRSQQQQFYQYQQQQQVQQVQEQKESQQKQHGMSILSMRPFTSYIKRNNQENNQNLKNSLNLQENSTDINKKLSSDKIMKEIKQFQIKKRSISKSHKPSWMFVEHVY